MTKTYRAVLEITDDCIPQPLNRQEIKSLIEEEPSRIFGGVKVTCIELTEVSDRQRPAKLLVENTIRSIACSRCAGYGSDCTRCKGTGEEP